MFKKIAVLITAFAMLFLFGCGSGGDESENSVSGGTTPQSGQQSTAGEPIAQGVTRENYPVIAGSTANQPLIAALYSRLLSIPIEEAETLVDPDGGGTGSVWRYFLSGDGVDLLIAYEPPEEIKTEYSAELEEMEIDPIGRDALVFLVNSHNPVDSLTVEQLQKVYTGEITDWGELGSGSGPIQPFQRNSESGSQTLFLKLLMTDGLIPMEPLTDVVPTMGGLIDQVASYDGSGGALGYSVYYYADLMYSNPDLKLLKVDGVAPSGETIADKSYPLTNDFYLAIRADTPEDSPIRQVRDWLLSAEGKKLLEDNSYVWARNGLPEQSTGAGNPF